MNPSIEFKDTNPLVVDVPDINYIPGYKKAEEERRKNEEERIAYYNEIQRKVDNGEFKGDKGDKGDKGEKGDTPVKGVDYWTEEEKTNLQNECNEYIDSRLGIINQELATLTDLGGGE